MTFTTTTGNQNKDHIISKPLKVNWQPNTDDDNMVKEFILLTYLIYNHFNIKYKIQINSEEEIIYASQNKKVFLSSESHRCSEITGGTMCILRT